MKTCKKEKEMTARGCRVKKGKKFKGKQNTVEEEETQRKGKLYVR